MIGKRAKLLSAKNVEDLLVFATQTRHPLRNEVLVLLSVKACLRAGEIANLTWPMLVEPTGEIARSLELQDRAAKKGSGRVIPIHPDLHAALVKLAQLTLILDGPVIQSEHGGPMSPDPTTRNALPNQATMLMIYSFSFQGISDQVAIIWRNMAERAGLQSARNRQSHRGL